MSYYVGLPLLLLVALLEVSVAPMFRVAGLQPNLMLVLLIAWLIVRGAGEAFILAPVGGVLLGLVDGAPAGTALIGLAPLAFLQDLRGSQLREGGLIMAVAFTIVMSFFYNYVHLAVFTLQGLPHVIQACQEDIFEAPLAELRDYLAPTAADYFPALR